jgi:hypothetical protein
VIGHEFGSFGLGETYLSKIVSLTGAPGIPEYFIWDINTRCQMDERWVVLSPAEARITKRIAPEELRASHWVFLGFGGL